MAGAVDVIVDFLFLRAVRAAGPATAGTESGGGGVLDARWDGLHDLVVGKLGDDSALRRLVEEAASGAEGASPRTRMRVQMALEDIADDDREFGGVLFRAAAELRCASGELFAPGVVSESPNTFNGPTGVQIGNYNRQDNTFN